MNYYNSISRGYEELHREEQLKKLELIKKFLKVSPQDKLLDVGCGTGLTTSRWKCKCFGIDPSKKLLTKAKTKYKKIIFKQASAENIPFEDNFFDIVISVTAIQNFTSIEKGFKEMKRVGKNRFVLTFLKKSQKNEKIVSLIKKIFSIGRVIEEEKDMIYFVSKK